MKHRITIDDTLRKRLLTLRDDAVPNARKRLADRIRTETLGELVRTSPVRTGRLRGSWQQAEAGGGPDGSTSDVDASDHSQRDATSHVDYARYVEYGTSRQAPQRLVGRAIGRVARLAKSLFRLP